MAERLDFALCVAAVVLGLSLLVAQPAAAIVVSDDPDLHEIAPPSDFDMVGYLNRAYGTTAAMLDSWYLLSAGHALNDIEGGTLTLHLEDGPHVFSLAEAWKHPTADIGVARLAAETALTGYELYDGTGELYEEAILAGYGMSGTGDTVEAGGDPDYPRGTGRTGWNKIDAFSTDNGVEYLRFDFDAPGTGGPSGSLGADKEAMIAAGDSGGPVFLDVGGDLQIAGVSVSVRYNDANHWPTWGDLGYAVRVSNYAGWIRGLLPGQPATETGDFNSDGAVNVVDVDALSAMRREGGWDLWFDLTADGLVNAADSDVMIHQFIGSEYGDADLNYEVGGDDYTTWADHYGHTQAGWSDADFTADAIVDGADYTLWADNYGFGAGSGGESEPGGFALLPEPGALLLLAAGSVPLAVRRRRLGGRGGLKAARPSRRGRC